MRYLTRWSMIRGYDWRFQVLNYNGDTWYGTWYKFRGRAGWRYAGEEEMTTEKMYEVAGEPVRWKDDFLEDAYDFIDAGHYDIVMAQMDEDIKKAASENYYCRGKAEYLKSCLRRHLLKHDKLFRIKWRSKKGFE